MNPPAHRNAAPRITKADVARLLTLIASLDQRTIGETDVEAWYLVASSAGWTLPYASRAVVEFQRDATDERIRPGHITRTIRTRREAAAASYRLQDFPTGMTDHGDQQRWQDAQRAAHIAAVMDAWARGEA